VGPRTSLDDVRRKTCSYQNSISDTSTVQPVASRYIRSKAKLIINLKHYASVILATLFLRIEVSSYHAIMLMY
jgi:hypothetical protein